jgi:hypothetical protein
MESTITAKIATNSSELLERYQFLSPGFWFNTPESLSLDKLVMFEVLATLVFATNLILIAIRFGRRNILPPDEKFLNKVILYTVWFGPMAWLLVIFRNWGVVFLSARFIWILWALSLGGVGLLLLKEFKSKLPASKQNYFSYQLKKSYFPKKRKKK